jgi:hypothetical protein
MSLQIEDWDFVRDPMDNSIRQVASRINDTLYMVDGGVMGVDEVTEVILESEMYG